jgi:hypothetical protein
LVGDDFLVLTEQDNVKRAKQKFQRYCNYIEKNFENFPSYEIDVAQDFVLQCVRIDALSENY